MGQKDRSYGQQLLTVAPAFAAKSLIGDLPKGGLEYAVERKASGSNAKLLTLLKAGLKGRGSGRALGAGLGILTAPAYLKGVKLVGSEEASQRKKGLGLLFGSAAGYASAKGLVEGSREARVGGASMKKSLGAGANRAAARALVKSPQALLMGLSVAAGRKKSKGSESPGIGRKLVLPALTGAALSAGGRFVEQGLISGIKTRSLGKTLRKALPSAAGGAAGGALGGLVLAGITDRALKALKGKQKQKQGSVGALGIVGHLMGAHAATKGLLSHGRGSKRVVDAATRGTASKFGKRLRARQMGIGIREGIAGRKTPGFRSAAILNMSVPELHFERGSGLALGRLLRALPEHKRAGALRKMQKEMGKRRSSLAVTPSGTDTPIISSMERGIGMALGDESFYKKNNFTGRHLPTFKKAWKKLVLGKRGAQGTGLPTAGRSDVSSKFKAKAEDLVGGVASTALLAKGVATANPLAATTGAHGLVGALKSLGGKTQTMADLGTIEFRKGIRTGMGLGRESQTGRIKRHLLDTLVSPGTSFSQSMGETLGAAGASEAKQRASALLKRRMATKRMRPKEMLAPAALGGGAAALATNR